MPASKESEPKRPTPSKKPSKSFSRYEPEKPAKSSRSRATTLSDEVTAPQLLSTFDEPLEASTESLQKAADGADTPVTADHTLSLDIERFPADFDQLPVELASLTDRFIASLTSAKIYTTPPQIEKLSDLFQEFYSQAEVHISTHIQELSSRQYRDTSPAPSASSRSSTRTFSKSAKDGQDKGEKAVPGQKMLTSDEIHERKKARKLLEYKRVALEEAVERRVCEKIYERIWQHRSTLDEIRDEKLRSRTAGLAVVGVGLKELGVELNLNTEAKEWIAKAQQTLLDMDKTHYPLGKLQSLAAAHQNVVELLAVSHQGSSSADEILPALIYVLISATEPLSLISNLNFIQRFRTETKITGEAAYCLTNLEAAITFLETVDLATLNGETEPRSTDEQSSKPAGAVPGRLRALSATTGPAPGPTSSPQQSSKPAGSRAASSLTIDIKPSSAVSPAAPSPSNRLSNLFQPPAALGAASDAVRNTADEGLRNIGSALDKSFSFMFGRLKEQNTTPTGTVVAPKTLDEARRLVSPKAMVEDDGSLSENVFLAGHDDRPPKDDRLLDMIAGSRPARDRSADSTGSGSRARADSKSAVQGSAALGVSPPISASGAVESMKNLGSSLNRFASINMMKGFNRAASSPSVATQMVTAQSSMDAHLEPAVAAAEKVEPPIQRFLEINDAQDLKLGDIEILLKDYQRLSAVLKTRGVL